MASGALKGKKVAIASTDLPDQVDVDPAGVGESAEAARASNVVAYDVMPCQGNIVCTQPIPQSVMKLAAAKPDVVIPILTATTLPVYVNEMKQAGMKAKLYESSYNALGTDLVQSKVLQVGGKEVADYYKGATLVSATVTGDWRLPGFGPPPIGVMCNDTYAANTTTGDGFEPDTEGYSKWGMVGLSCTNMRMVARAMYDAGENLTQQTFVDALRKLPADPIGGIGGAPVVVYIDKNTTPTTAFESPRHLPVQAPGPARGHDLPHPREHQRPHHQAVAPQPNRPTPEPASKRRDYSPSVTPVRLGGGAHEPWHAPILSVLNVPSAQRRLGFSWEKTPSGLSHEGTTQACTIQPVIVMKFPPSAAQSGLGDVRVGRGQDRGSPRAHVAVAVPVVVRAREPFGRGVAHGVVHEADHLGRRAGAVVDQRQWLAGVETTAEDTPVPADVVRPTPGAEATDDVVARRHARRRSSGSASRCHVRPRVAAGARPGSRRRAARRAGPRRRRPAP